MELCETSGDARVVVDVGGNQFTYNASEQTLTTGTIRALLHLPTACSHCASFYRLSVEMLRRRWCAGTLAACGPLRGFPADDRFLLECEVRVVSGHVRTS